MSPFLLKCLRVLGGLARGASPVAPYPVVRVSVMYNLFTRIVPSISSNIFILLLGFVFGNLFPTFFGEFLGKVATPIFIFILLDSFNYFYYSLRSEKGINKKKSTRSLQNSLKIGFLFGLFVDAFKVGS